MSQLIITFVGVAIAIGIITVLISTSYDAITLPSADETPAIPATVPPNPDEIDDLVLWLDADDSSTISIGVGVSQWDDKSGEGNHVTQSTASKQPTVLTNAINGHDAISFDGSSDILRRNTFTGGTISQPTTVVMVVKGDPSSSTTNYYFDGAHATNKHSLFETNVNIFRANAGTSLSASSSLPTSYTFLIAEFDGASSEIFYDNVSKGSGNTGTNGLIGVVVGASQTNANPAEAEYAEIMVYDDILTTDEKNNLTDYIETKYNLGLTITGNYTAEIPAMPGIGNGWDDAQTILNTQAISATGLLVIVLVIIAAVVVLVYVKKL